MERKHRSAKTVWKKIAKMAIDALLMVIGMLMAVPMVYGFRQFTQILKMFLCTAPLLTLLTVVIFYCFGLYKIIWKYAGSIQVVKLAMAVLVTDCLYYGCHEVLLRLFSANSGVFRHTFVSPIFVSISYRIYVAGAVFSLMLVTLVRLLMRQYIISKTGSKDTGKKDKQERVLVIGGGNAGAMVIKDIVQGKTFHKVVGVIDDDPAKKDLSVYGVKILGDRSDIPKVCTKLNVDTILFCIASCDARDRVEILNICASTGCTVKVLPGIVQLMDGRIDQSLMRKVEIEDLLERDPIHIDNNTVLDFVKGKVVLVTGGGGSIGSELCRQVASHEPKELIIFDIYENNAYAIQNELKRKRPDLHLTVLIGSVRDEQRLRGIFEEHRPNIVFHAAAHKHVPLMEDSPREAIKNNVFGTLNTVKTADAFGVERFVLISTDKAVNPTNVMGATKRICEMIVQTYNNLSKTEYVAVRFGNVLGSNGSVVPLFKEQIANGGPVTVTHPDIIRYFMTIPEAVSLVLQAGALAKGGEIFVLDMGKPVRILDMAEKLIRLSGYEPYTDIKIEFTGLRPGEKLYEELLMDEEGLSDTENKLIHIGRPIALEPDFLDRLEELRQALRENEDDVDARKVIKKLVPTYHTQM